MIDLLNDKINDAKYQQEDRDWLGDPKAAKQLVDELEDCLPGYLEEFANTDVLCVGEAYDRRVIADCWQSAHEEGDLLRARLKEIRGQKKWIDQWTHHSQLIDELLDQAPEYLRGQDAIRRVAPHKIEWTGWPDRLAVGHAWLRAYNADVLGKGLADKISRLRGQRGEWLIMGPANNRLLKELQDRHRDFLLDHPSIECVYQDAVVFSPDTTGNSARGVAKLWWEVGAWLDETISEIRDQTACWATDWQDNAPLLGELLGQAPGYLDDCPEVTEVTAEGIESEWKTPRMTARRVARLWLEAHQDGAFEPDHRLLPYFAYDHLPEDLQEVSRPFARLAQKIAGRPGDDAEQTVALRKLLEAKDAAVRAEVTDG